MDKTHEKTTGKHQNRRKAAGVAQYYIAAGPPQAQG
jgi:hypothetical protein